MVEKVLELNREKTIFWTLVGGLFIAMLFYIYFINITVHNTVARQNYEAESSTLTLAIGNKEFEYISKRNNITLALAHSLGYKDTKTISYIEADGGRTVALR